MRYRAAYSGGTVWLRATGFTYAWANAGDVAKLAQSDAGSMGTSRATPTARLSGQHVEETCSNYFVGNDPSRWVSHVRSCQEVRDTALYPGTDLRVYGTATGQFEHDLTLAPEPTRCRACKRCAHWCASRYILLSKNLLREATDNGHATTPSGRSGLGLRSISARANVLNGSLATGPGTTAKRATKCGCG